MLDTKKFDEFEEKHYNATKEQADLENYKDSVKEDVVAQISEEFTNGEILIDTRWSQRGYNRYGGTLRIYATTSGNNDVISALAVRLKALDVTSINFGKGFNFQINYGGECVLTGEEDPLMAFCFERNITITDNETNKRIKELKKTIDSSETELGELRERKNELAKKKRELASKRKVDATLSNEWFDKG